MPPFLWTADPSLLALNILRKVILMKTFGVGPGKLWMCLIPFFLLLLIPASNIRAEIRSSDCDCSQIEADDERLKCYDEKHGLVQEESSNDSSFLSQLWELNPRTRLKGRTIMIHRSTYILPAAYNSRPNKEPIQNASPGKDVKNMEFKFQFSMKVKVWQDIFDKDMDLWFAYTQKSFWQLYNFEDSSPFRETNYEPEMLLNFRLNIDRLGLKWRTFTLGFNHQSNGRSEPLSRSWNRVVGNFGFERGNFTLLLNTWYRLPENDADDDNPEIEDYMGYGEIWGYYIWNEHRFGVMLRNNLQNHDNRGAVQLEWCIPFFDKGSWYIQYYNGYGESLLDYDHNVNRISAGVILRNW